MNYVMKMTEEQVQRIWAGTERRGDLLSPEEVKTLAAKLNEHINIPFLGEEKEAVVLIKIIKLVDTFLHSVLPEEVYELVKSTTDGISKEEAITIKKRLTAWINKSVNIPYLPEGIEEAVFGILVGLFVDAMKKGFSILEDRGA